MDKNLIRHNTLKILAGKFYQVNLEDYKGHIEPPEGSTNIPVKKICDELNITDLEFRRSNVYTFTRKEIFYYTPDDVCILSQGLDAFEDNKYLKMRWSEKNEKIFILTKWIIPIIALIISLVALIISVLKMS